MAAIADNVTTVRQRIAEAATRSGRSPQAVRVIAVTKLQDPAVLAGLAAAGIHDYGENRPDHLDEMRRHAPPESRFHYIGRVQSRQFSGIVPVCTSLHSLAEERHVPKLVAACRRAGVRLPVFVQVDTAGEEQKAGIAPQQLAPMLDAVRAAADALDLLGLMCMAPDRSLPGVDDDRIRRCFSDLRQLGERHHCRRLSMGMSGDYQIAVEEGSTDVRIGSTLFR
jgi:pyridoxal phosphate enzyme (YggS family)